MHVSSNRTDQYVQAVLMEPRSSVRGGGVDMTVETIFEPLVRRNEAEFEKLVERTQRQAYNMAYRMTGNRDDAEDLTQEAYLRAYRSFEKYNRALPFENWFFRILSNLFVDRLRRKPKQTPLSLSQSIANADGDDDFT